jgi:hypothetical protein
MASCVITIVSHKPITKEQFLKERKATHSTIASTLPTRQSHQLKMCTKSPAPRDMLSPKPTTSPPRNKSKTTFGTQVVDLKEDEE